MSDPVRIPLGNPPVAYALVDADDADRINKHRWLMASGYATRSEKTRGKRATVYMHREVLEVADPDVAVDHINRNPIDNRRSNLRVLTQAQNNQNIPVREFTGGSIYRGVTVTPQGKFIAIVSTHYLGTFTWELDAALAAEAYRREHMPFAEPNPALVRIGRAAA